MTNCCLRVSIDRGDLQLLTPVAELIPEFGVKGKQRVTVAQLLTHTAGMPVELPFMNPADFGDTTKMALAVADQALVTTPGRIVSYSPIGAFAVLGEIVRRVDPAGRALRTILEEEARVAQAFVHETAARLDAELLEQIREAGVAVNEPDPEPFLAASGAMYHEYASTVEGGAALLERARGAGSP